MLHSHAVRPLHRFAVLGVLADHAAAGGTRVCPHDASAQAAHPERSAPEGETPIMEQSMMCSSPALDWGAWHSIRGSGSMRTPKGGNSHVAGPLTRLWDCPSCVRTLGHGALHVVAGQPLTQPLTKMLPFLSLLRIWCGVALSTAEAAGEGVWAAGHVRL